MLIDFECKNCGTDVEVDTDDLLEESGTLKCPHCRNKLPPKVAEQLASSVDDLVAQLWQIRRKFGFTIAFDSDDADLFEEAAEDDEGEWEDEDEIGDEPFEEEL